MANVPKFGNWEDDDNVSYTQYFEDTRKIKVRGNLTNISDPHDDLISNGLRQNQASTCRVNAKTVDLHLPRREQGHLQRPTSFPSHDEGKGWKPGTDSLQQGRYKLNPGGTQRRGSQMNAGSECSPANSPFNPHISLRVADKLGPGSPSWERRGPSESGCTHAFAPNTPERSRLRMNGQSNENHKKRLPIPRFGEWDVNDPAAGEAYTHVFDRVRVEKQRVSGNISATATKPVVSKGDEEDQSGSSKALVSSVPCRMVQLVVAQILNHAISYQHS